MNILMDTVQVVSLAMIGGMLIYVWVKYRRLSRAYQLLYDHARANGLITTKREMMETMMRVGGFGHVHLSEPIFTSANPEEDPEDAA